MEHDVENCLFEKPDLEEAEKEESGGIGFAELTKGMDLAIDFADFVLGESKNRDLQQDFAAAVMAKFSEKKNCERAREEAMADFGEDRRAISNGEKREKGRKKEFGRENGPSFSVWAGLC